MKGFSHTRTNIVMVVGMQDDRDQAPFTLPCHTAIKHTIAPRCTDLHSVVPRRIVLECATNCRPKHRPAAAGRQADRQQAGRQQADGQEGREAIRRFWAVPCNTPTLCFSPCLPFLIHWCRRCGVVLYPPARNKASSRGQLLRTAAYIDRL